MWFAFFLNMKGFDFCEMIFFPGSHHKKYIFQTEEGAIISFRLSMHNLKKNRMYFVAYGFAFLLNESFLYITAIQFFWIGTIGIYSLLKMPVSSVYCSVFLYFGRQIALQILKTSFLWNSTHWWHQKIISRNGNKSSPHWVFTKTISIDKGNVKLLSDICQYKSSVYQIKHFFGDVEKQTFPLGKIH